MKINYYFKKVGDEHNINLYIGKYYAGYGFTLRIYPELDINNEKDWSNFIDKAFEVSKEDKSIVKIYDEYDKRVSKKKNNYMSCLKN